MAIKEMTKQSKHIAIDGINLINTAIHLPIEILMAIKYKASLIVTVHSDLM